MPQRQLTPAELRLDAEREEQRLALTDPHYRMQKRLAFAALWGPIIAVILLIGYVELRAEMVAADLQQTFLLP